jgi:hypothetical protein
MPMINLPTSGHVGPAPLVGGHSYLTYTNATFLHTLNSAVHIITKRIFGYAPCDAAFTALPGGRTFREVWADPDVWLNFDPSRRQGDFGATRGNDITITAFSLAMGRWTVAATIVHEMAHVNGAPGNTHAAEATLRDCLLKGLEDPTIIGAIPRSPRSFVV